MKAVYVDNIDELGSLLAMLARQKNAKPKKKVKLQLVRPVPEAKNTQTGYDSTQSEYTLFGLFKRFLLG